MPSNDKRRTSAYVQDGEGNLYMSNHGRDLLQDAIIEDIANPECSDRDPNELGAAIRDDNYHHFLQRLNLAFFARREGWACMAAEMYSAYKVCRRQLVLTKDKLITHESLLRSSVKRCLDFKKEIDQLDANSSTLRLDNSKLQRDNLSLEHETIRLQHEEEEGAARERQLCRRLVLQKDESGVCEFKLKEDCADLVRQLEYQHDVNIHHLDLHTNLHLTDQASAHHHEVNELANEIQSYKELHSQDKLSLHDAMLDSEQAEADKHLESVKLANAVQQRDSMMFQLSEKESELETCRAALNQMTIERDRYLERSKQSYAQLQDEEAKRQSAEGQEKKLHLEVIQGRNDYKALMKRFLWTRSCAILGWKKGREGVDEIANLRTTIKSLEEQVRNATEKAAYLMKVIELHQSQSEGLDQLKNIQSGTSRTILGTISAALKNDSEHRAAHRLQLDSVRQLSRSVATSFGDVLTSLKLATNEIHTREVPNSGALDQDSSTLPPSVQEIKSATGEIKDLVDNFIEFVLNQAAVKGRELNATRQQADLLTEVELDMRDERDFLEADIDTLNERIESLNEKIDTSTTSIGMLDDMLNESLSQNKAQTQRIRQLESQIGQQSRIIKVCGKELEFGTTYIQDIVNKNHQLSQKLAGARDDMGKLARRNVLLIEMAYDFKRICAALEEGHAARAYPTRIVGAGTGKRKSQSACNSADAKRRKTA